MILPMMKQADPAGVRRARHLGEVGCGSAARGDLRRGAGRAAVLASLGKAPKFL